MAEMAAKRARFNWWLPGCGIAGALIVLLPTFISGNDLGAFVLSGFLFLFVGAVMVLFAFSAVFYKRWKDAVNVLKVLFVYCIALFGLWAVSWNVHIAGKWMFGARHYKAAVLAQPIDINGELKHIEWEGWGFAGDDTTMYLVYDPNDSLAAIAKSHAEGKFAGLPCEVSAVRRLEKQWYYVVFYTNTDWEQCAE